jgi:hypothetical protein
MIKEKGFLTLAFGSSKYIRMARGLARSMRHNGVTSPLAVVTDRSEADLPEFDITIPHNRKFGSGVSQKLHLDRYSPFEETLFIDSDCLVFDNPEELWSVYRRSDGFGVLAWTYKHKGENHPFIRDLDAALDSLSIDRMPFFNGGIYYFDKSDHVANIFNTARNLLSDREMLSLKSFRDSPVNEEPVLALAMEEEGVEALSFEKGNLLNTGLSASLEPINVLTGESTYLKNGSPTSPRVVHFNTPSVQNGYVYRRELWRLKLAKSSWPVALSPLLGRGEHLALWTARICRRLNSRLDKYGLRGVIPARYLRE